MKVSTAIIGLALLFIQCKPTESSRLAVSEITPFGVCYAKVTPDLVENYRMVILEPSHYSASEVQALKATGVKVLAYLSLGEVNPYRWYFSELEEIGLLGENENWGSYYINLKDQKSRDFLVHKAGLRIHLKGFDGYFLDTVDAVAPYTDRNNMQGDMLKVIEGLRQRFPESIIIQNAGLFLLNQSKAFVDAVAIEDIATLYDFEQKEYQLLSEADFKGRIDLINKHHNESGLPFLIIDFSDTEEDIRLIKQRLDPLKTPYFISTIGLDQLPSNPLEVANKVTD